MSRNTNEELRKETDIFIVFGIVLAIVGCAAAYFGATEFGPVCAAVGLGTAGGALLFGEH